MTDIISTLKRLVQQPDDTLSVEQCINHWLKTAKRIVTLVNAHPAIPASLVQLSAALPFCTKQTLLLALFCKLNRFNDHYTQHVIATVIAAHWCQSKANKAESITPLLRVVKTKKLMVWIDVLRIQKVMLSDKCKQALGDLRISESQRLCLISAAMADSKVDALPSAKFSAFVKATPVHHRDYYTALCDLFAKPMPGAKVYVNGKPGVVIDLQQRHAFIFSLSEKDAEGEWFPLSAVVFPKPLFIPFEHFIAVYTDTAEQRVSEGGNTFLPVSFDIQHPPRSLLSIIDELQKRDVDIPTLCSSIEKVDTFNRFLIHTAGKDNRLQIPVKNIKQAVMTYGIERVGDMLMQFALLERLTQNTFPLLGMCKQFTLLSCAIASHVASICNSKFSPQSAALTMTFICAPLFTLPGLKVAQRLPINFGADLRINQGFRVKSQTPWLSISSELAGNWHQSATWRAVLHHCAKQNEEVPKSLKQEHAIMLISFALAKECLFKGDMFSLKQDVEFKMLLKQISTDFTSIVEGVERQGPLLFCPLTH